MKRLAAIGAIALICIAAVAVATPSGDNKGGDTKSVTGTVSRLDLTQKMMVVKDAANNEITVYWKDGTNVPSDLREGQQVRVETKEQDGKTWATSIEVAKKPY
jgi:hypothetical protein